MLGELFESSKRIQLPNPSGQVQEAGGSPARAGSARKSARSHQQAAYERREDRRAMPQHTPFLATGGVLRGAIRESLGEPGRASSLERKVRQLPGRRDDA